jgi:mRNA interferase HicA
MFTQRPARSSSDGLNGRERGATFEPAKGGHLWVMLHGRRAILPMHGSRKEMKRGTIAATKKQLALE